MMQISSVQNSTSITALQNQENQLYSQIQSLKRKDAKGNAAQIEQLQQQLNTLLNQQDTQSQSQLSKVQTQSQSELPPVQNQSAEPKESSNPPTNAAIPNPSSVIGNNIDTKA